MAVESLASDLKIQSGSSSNMKMAFFGAKGAKVSIIKLEFQILLEKHSHNCAENQHNFYLGEKRRVMLCLLFSTESVIQLRQFATRQNQSRALVNKLSVVASYNWGKILLNSYVYLYIYNLLISMHFSFQLIIF